MISVGGPAVAVSVALLAASAPADAAPKPVTGKLSKPGYTVIALAANGRATSTRARRGKFRLSPPAGRVTLHLRAPNGTYAGPIVVGHAGKRAIVGVKAGARLGTVAIRRGYARLSKRLRTKWVDPSRTARARGGVPIGAGSFGRVRSRPPRRSIPGDTDLDGVPNPLDIDDDGDLILDNLDRSTAPRAAQAGTPVFISSLSLDLSQTANANGGSRSEDIESALPGAGGLQVPAPPGTTMELDCAGDPTAVPPRPGLIYCSRGGTGRRGGPLYGFKRFPEDFDPDGDGFGTLTPPPGGDLLHGARSDQIKTGDVLIEHVTTRGGDESLCPPPSGGSSPHCTSYAATLQYVFATVPALFSYRDGADPPNAATVSYPVGPGARGTRGNGFPVAAGCRDVVVPCNPADVFVTLTFWRPQRRPIGEGENREACLNGTPPCAWVDIGGLTYSGSTGVVLPSGPPVFGNCPQSAYSAASGQPLGTPPPGISGLTDTRPDQPASPSNTLTYTLNLTRCRASLGIPWTSGEATFGFGARAYPALDSASQSISFKQP